MVEGKPTVTVYITNYNYGRYLAKAIDSVLGQTFADFELIIIDDGSTDDSYDILKEYEVREGIFVILQQNKGLTASNNIALKQARGRYIMRLDADDYLDAHALEIMVGVLERRSDLAMVFPDYYLVDEDGVVVDQVRRHDFAEEVTLLDLPAHGACTMIRRKVLTSIGGYDEVFDRQDGYDLWLNVVDQHAVENVNLPLFYYRRHATSLTGDEQRLLRTRSEIKAKHVAKRGVKPLSVLTVVPVRGTGADPRSLPLNDLGSKKLIDWTLDAALEASCTDNILVTTPDARVREHVRERYGSDMDVVARSLALARLNTGGEQTILHALEHYGSTHAMPDAVLVLYVEAPFRSAMYIDKIVHTMQLYDVDVVDGVRQDDSLFYVHNGEGLKPWKSGALRLEREDLYRRVGGLHLIRRAFLQRHGQMLGGRIGHIVLDQKAAFVIRSALDWQIARLLVAQEAEGR